MTRDEMKRFWGSGNLIRWPRQVLESTHLPEDAKSFLAEVGLPLNVDWTMRFNLDTRQVFRTGKNHTHCIIGFDDTVPICLREDRGGIVVWAEEGGPERFANSSVMALGEFLVLYQTYRTADLGPAESEDDLTALIDHTEEIMRSKDPRSLAGPENVWSVIVEQMRDGLL
jgi:hypothetical protein